MGKLSRNKGKVGEREFARALESLGYVARRGVQHAGTADSPDVISNISGVHFEVKRTETLHLWKAFDQATEDAGPDQTPVIAHRANRRPWILILPLERVVEFAESILWSNQDETT